MRVVFHKRVTKYSRINEHCQKKIVSLSEANNVISVSVIVTDFGGNLNSGDLMSFLISGDRRKR